MGWVRRLGFDMRRRPLEGNFAHCDSCQTNFVGLHHPLKRCGQGQLHWPGNFHLPTARWDGTAKNEH